MANKRKEWLGKKIVELHNEGYTQYEISKQLNMQPSLVAYYIQQYKKK